MADPTRIVVAGRAHIWLAPIGTVAPANSSVAMPTGWVDVGLTTEDSLVFQGQPTFGTVRSHQSDFPTRIFQISDGGHVDVDLQEFSANGFQAVFGGGSITQISAPTGVTPGQYQWNPPLVGGRTNVACIAEVIDGAKNYRYVVPTAFQDAGVQMKLQRKAESTLPLRLQVLGSDGVAPWYLLTNDPAFSPTAVP